MNRRGWRISCAFLALGLFLAKIISAAEDNGFGLAEYLLEGFGARAAGMGAAQTAMPAPACAPYWNAAGLGDLAAGSGEYAGQYSFLSHGRWLNYSGCAAGLDNFGFGMSWINFDVGNIKAWTVDDRPDGELSSVENTWVLAVGCRLLENLNLGAGGKVFHQALGGLIATGYGWDISAMAFLFPGKTLRLGLNLQNVGARLTANTGREDRGPMNLKFGCAWLGLPDEVTQQNRLRVAADVDGMPAHSWAWHMGAEYRVFNTLVMRQGQKHPTQCIFLRAGYDRGRLTCGAGYAPYPYALDYALILDPAGLQPWNASHRISLSIGWDPDTRPPDFYASNQAPKPLAGEFVPELGRPWNDMVHTYYAEAVRLRGQGQDQEAAALLARALELDPNQRQVMALALEIRETAQVRETLNLQAEYAAKANQAEAAGKWTQAAGWWRKTLALNPEHAEACRKWTQIRNIAADNVYRAKTALEKRDVRRARTWLLQALNLDPEAAEAEKLLAGIRFAKRRRQVATASESRWKDDYAAGRAACEAGNYARAIEIWSAWLRRRPDDADLRQALVLAKNGRQRQWDEAAAHYLQGLQCYQLGKYHEAREHWRQTLRLHPGHAKARKNMLKLE